MIQSAEDNNMGLFTGLLFQTEVPGSYIVSKASV